MKFQVLKKSKQTKARVGKIELKHGSIDTPNFVPVGTQASVKALTPRDLKEIGVQIFFANTYHLYLRPGEKVIDDQGGLQKFTAWHQPIMTDSGGFQVFSLGLGKYKLKIGKDKVKIKLEKVEKGVSGPSLAEISDNGVKFKSHLDGSEHFLTPEKSMAIQHALSADIMMAFDDCTPYPCEHDYAQESMLRTHRWLERSLAYHQKNKKEHQNLYGVVHGSTFQDLRIKSAQFVSSQETPGIAIGGVSVGESKKQMRKVLDWVEPHLDPEKPRHLLGVGEIDDVFEAIERGIDTMDCVTPTRWARNGTLLVSLKTSQFENSKTAYRLLVKNAKYVNDSNPIEPNCQCFVCQNFSRAYLNHLYRANEILGLYLGTYHNVYFMIDLFKKIRHAIQNDQFLDLKKKWLKI